MSATSGRPGALTADDILTMPDPELKALIEEDLRAGPWPRTRPTAASVALRAPENLERVYSVAVRMLMNTTGQLAGRESDFKRVKADLLGTGRGRQAEYLVKRGEYEEQRGKTVRFKTSLEQFIAEIKHRREAQRQSQYGGVMDEERYRLQQRVRHLEDAIRRHKETITQDDENDLDPADLELWSTIAENAADGDLWAAVGDTDDVG